MLKFKDFCILEMARSLGSSLNLLDKESDRKYYFNLSKGFKKYKSIINSIVIVYRITNSKGNKQIEFYTNDNILGETLHFSILNILDDENLNKPILVQNIVNRFKTDRLPKNYSVDFLITYFLKQTEVKFLRSSNRQYDQGHLLWEKIITRCLQENIPCYYFDENEEGNFIKLTKENVDYYLELSFDKGEEYENRHLIISKERLPV